MAYNHGIVVNEKATEVVNINQSSSGLHVVIGVAPINTAKDPYSVTNKPILCSSYKDAIEKLGSSSDFSKFNISEAISVYFNLFNVAPVVFINVLDPEKHVTDIAEKTLTVTNKQAVLTEQGVLLKSVVVKNDTTPLVADTDYILSFDDDGNTIITFIKNGEIPSSVKVTAKKIDTSKVTEDDIIGGYDSEIGINKGIEVIRDVYPTFSQYISIILSPGYTSSKVAAVLQAKCEEINGIFKCETIIDIDTSKAKKYSDCEKVKKDNTIISEHAIAVWPKATVDDVAYNMSTVIAACMLYNDIQNDDVPSMSPSNKSIPISGLCDSEGKEIILDVTQANTLNAVGIVTAINFNGWKTWGNNTAIYPISTDPKDRWIACRRFFTWMENRFINEYISKVDSSANYRIIETLVESENVFCSSLVADGKCAGAYVDYSIDENGVPDLIEGKIAIRQHLAPFTPAESITNTFDFDTELLKNALSEEIGGNK
jgi:phage tail sheath protein FI